MSQPFRLTAESVFATLDLTPSDRSLLTECIGINPPKANLLSTQIYNKDGSFFQSSVGQNRYIVLSIYIFKNVNENRAALLECFRSGEKIRLMYETGNESKKIDGYIESIDYDRFATPKKAKQTIQISITCFDPWFYGDEVSETVSGDSTVIEYIGKIAAPFAFEIDVDGSQYVPPYILDYVRFRVVCNENNFIFYVHTSKIETLRKIIIDTNKRTLDLVESDGVITSGIAGIHSLDSQWPVLKQGRNNISAAIEINGPQFTWENLDGVLTYTPLFEGL